MGTREERVFTQSESVVTREWNLGRRRTGVKLETEKTLISIPGTRPLPHPKLQLGTGQNYR